MLFFRQEPNIRFELVAPVSHVKHTELTEISSLKPQAMLRQQLGKLVETPMGMKLKPNKYLPSHPGKFLSRER